MIKILVVEDEYLMRERLEKTIDWASIGCEVVACAENGLEAIEIINRTIPDLVITDIKMPKMDGLELCQFIHSNYEFIKVIIMTGYGEFTYAQNAVRLGVNDYILKPSDKREIMESVKKIVSKIENERELYATSQRLNDAITENLTYLRAKIFDDILNGFTFHIEEQNKKLGDIIKKNSTYVIMSIKVEVEDTAEDNGNEDELSDFTKIKNAIEAFNAKVNYDSIVSITNTTLYIILFFDESFSSSHINTEIREYAERLQKYLKDVHDICISMGISRCCIDIAELEGAFKEAEKRLKNEAFFSNGGIVVQVHENDFSEESISNYPLIEINKLLNLINNGEKEDVEDIVKAFLLKLSKSKGCTGEYIKSICVDIVLMCSNLLIEHNKKIEDIMESDISIYLSLSKLSNLHEVEIWMTNFLKKIMGAIAEKQKPLRKKYIEDVLDYINSNYMHDISLAKVAEHIHVHPVHLGRILRKELGENFVDIVLRVRIENAKKLLRDPNKKAYEVASSVGIMDSHYFSQLFKKYTGMTPTEFKESL